MFSLFESFVVLTSNRPPPEFLQNRKTWHLLQAAVEHEVLCLWMHHKFEVFLPLLFTHLPLTTYRYIFIFKSDPIFTENGYLLIF